MEITVSEQKMFMIPPQLTRTRRASDSWEARGKRAVVELDGITGESSTSGRAFQQQVRRIFNRDVLFDLGAESINLVVPGGAIALKIGKAVVDHRRQQQKGRS